MAYSDTGTREFICVLNLIEACVPVGKAIHVILDNCAAHKHVVTTPGVRRANDGGMLGLIATLAMTESQNFECSVQGSTLLAPATTVEDVCSRIAARTAQARERAAPVRISVRFTRAGVASARVTRTTDGHTEELPDISVATSDRAMSMQTVEMLADEIVRALAAR